MRFTQYISLNRSLDIWLFLSKLEKLDSFLSFRENRLKISQLYSCSTNFFSLLSTSFCPCGEEFLVFPASEPLQEVLFCGKWMPGSE